jgi:hypothetical protein
LIDDHFIHAQDHGGSIIRGAAIQGDAQQSLCGGMQVPFGRGEGLPHLLFEDWLPQPVAAQEQHVTALQLQAGIASGLLQGVHKVSRQRVPFPKRARHLVAIRMAAHLIQRHVALLYQSHRERMVVRQQPGLVPP